MKSRGNPVDIFTKWVKRKLGMKVEEAKVEVKDDFDYKSKLSGNLISFSSEDLSYRFSFGFSRPIGSLD